MPYLITSRRVTQWSVMKDLNQWRRSIFVWETFIRIFRKFGNVRTLPVDGKFFLKIFKKLWSEMTFLNFWKILKNCFFDTTYKIGFLAWSLITHYCVTRRDCVSCTSHHYFYHFNCWTFYSDKRRMYFAKIADSRVKLWWRTYSNRDVTFETLIYYPFKDG